MWKILNAIRPIEKSKQQARLTTCSECKFYRKQTKSCGPLIVGQTLTDEEKEELQITYYRKKVRLCGCYMPEKVKLAWSSCPVDKWGPIIRDVDLKVIETEREDILAFLNELRKTKSVAPDQLKKLYELGSQMMQKKIQPTTCPPCVNDMINYLYRELTKTKINN